MGFRTGEAVFARCLSALKDDRIAAAKVLPGPNPDKAGIVGNRRAFCEHIRKVCKVNSNAYLFYVHV